MRNLTYVFLISYFAVVTASAQKVKSDMDDSVDFSKFKTYAFAGWQKESDKSINQLDKDRITNALKNEFSLRGMQLVESNPDIYITTYIVLDNKTAVNAYTTYTGGAGGFRGAGWGWGGGFANTTYSESDYTEGTLVIDAYEGQTRDQIWQGVAQGTVKEKTKGREKRIDKTMAKIMKKYPVEIPK